MKSAVWSSFHSMMCPVGLLLLSREWVKVVGVCSVLSGPELVGELSYSTGRVGLEMAWRSNSSSASESSWYFVVYAMTRGGGLKVEWQQQEERPRAGTEVLVEMWVERDIESRPVMMPRPLSCKQAGSWRDKVCVIDGGSALDSRLAPGRLGHPV